MIDFIQVAPNGRIVMSGRCGDKDLRLQKMPGCILIAAKGSHNRHYYDFKNKQVVELPERPDTCYDFDYTAHQWVLNVDALREQRDQRLKESDWVLLDDVPMSAEKKEEWITYRQTLRDLPDVVRSSDVKLFEWPKKP